MFPTSTTAFRAVRALTTEAVKALIQAFVCCRLDYCNCNSLLYGVSDDLMRKLQSIQNAAARLIIGARRYDHIMHVLRQLHSLPVRRHVHYIIASCLLHLGLSPAYLANDINLAPTAAAVFSDQKLAGHVSFHVHIISRYLWRQEFRCGWSTSVEQSTVSVVTGHQLRTVQTTTENVSVRH